MGGRALMKVAPKAVRAAGRLIPGVRDVMHVNDALNELRGPAATPAAPASPAPASAPTVKISPSMHVLTDEDVATGRFGAMKAGSDIRRTNYEKTMMEAKPGKAPVRITASKSQPTLKAGTDTFVRKIERKPGPTIQNDQIVPAPPPGRTEAGNPQRGRFGQSKPGAPVREGNIIVGPGAGTAEEAAAARQAFLAERQAARGAGGTALRAVGPAMMLAAPVIAVIRHLASGGDIRDLGDPENVRRLLESAGIPMPQPAPQYGEPGYTGPI